MWITIKDKATKTTREANVCPQCVVEFEIRGYCKPCDRRYAHADKPIKKDKPAWHKPPSK